MDFIPGTALIPGTLGRGIFCTFQLPLTNSNVRMLLGVPTILVWAAGCNGSRELEMSSLLFLGIQRPARKGLELRAWQWLHILSLIRFSARVVRQEGQKGQSRAQLERG